MIADFSASVTTGQPGLTVQFTNTSELGAAVVGGWFWDFGDNLFSNLESPQHTYAEVGRYTVTLTVITEAGVAIEQKEDLIIIGNAPPREPGDGPPVLFVKKGAGEGTGTEEDPFTSIARAMAEAATYATDDYVVTVQLSAETYTEAVAFAPHVALRGADPSDRGATVIEPALAQVQANGDRAILAAENTVLANLTVVLQLTDVSDFRLLSIDGVKMSVFNVAFDGSNLQGTVGISIINLGSSATVVQDCLIRQCEYGVRALETGARITRTRFETIQEDALFVQRPSDDKGEEADVVPNMGDSSDLEETGQNSFDADSIGGAFINNLNESATIVAEGNEWGFDEFGQINPRMAGPGKVDFLPFRLSSNAGILTFTLAVLLKDGETSLPILTGTVSVVGTPPRSVSDNDDGVYVFPALPQGDYTVNGAMAGFQTASESVTDPGFIEELEISLTRTGLTLDAVATLLLDGFGSADTNDDGSLSFAEARAKVPAITQAQFDELAGGDSAISEAELDAVVNPPEPVGCPKLSGTSLGDTLRKSIGDFFLLGLALLGMLAWRGAGGRS